MYNNGYVWIFYMVNVWIYYIRCQHNKCIIMEKYEYVTW